MPVSIPARTAAFLVATLLLLVPAMWNGFPLLFYDTGAYLGRYFLAAPSPGRSPVYGFFLGVLRRPDFWPVVLAQSLVTVWTVALFLRAEGVGRRPVLLAALFAFLAAATSLPWLAGQLMPDIFAGLAVLALYLLVFRAEALARGESLALVLLMAFAAATHNATLAVLVLLLAAVAVARPLWPGAIAVAGLLRSLAAVLLGVAMLLAANFAVTGKLAWTPGGTAFVFSRLVHDGIVHRFLEDNCPDPRFELCNHRAGLPRHANDFLWHDGDGGPFAAIGGFYGGGAEMRGIALESLRQYPGLHLWKAVRATVEQLLAVGTGWGIVHDVWDSYGHIEQLTPEAVPAAHGARQRHGELDFAALNRLHVPVAWLAMGVLALAVLLASRGRGFAGSGALAATLAAALLANAFVCGVLSNAHDRYGARMAWLAVLFAAVALLRAVPTPHAPAEPGGTAPALSFARRRPERR